MKLYLISVFSLLALSGCSSSNVVPHFEYLDNPVYKYEDIIINGVKYHAYTEEEQQYVLGTTINLGLTANGCIQILRNVEASNK